jgi:hypothetical protein
MTKDRLNKQLDVRAVMSYTCVFLFSFFVSQSIFAAGLEGQTAEYGGAALAAGVKELEKVGWGPFRYIAGLSGILIAMYNAAFTQNFKAMGTGAAVCLGGVLGPSLVQGVFGAIIPF